MAKLDLVDIASLEAQASAIQSLNENSARIEEALENTLSRDGTSPNQMTVELDMNNQRIINLASPLSGTDAARLVDITEALVVTGTSVPAMSGNEDKIMTNDGSVLVWAEPSEIPGLGDLRAENNLDDVDDVVTARANLGLGTASLEDVGLSGDVIGKLDDNKIDSGNNTFTGTTTFVEAVYFSGTGDRRLIGNPSTVNEDSIGYRGTPIENHDATYAFVVSDSGKTMLHTSATPHTWTIPANSSVPYAVGTIIGLANIGSGAVTITRGAGVELRIAGTSTDADRSLVQHGLATIIKLATNVWYISGSGVS